MAITNTRSVQRIEVTPTGDDPSVLVTYIYTFDDPDDADLPTSTQSTKHLIRNTVTLDADGTETSGPTDVTGEDQLVQDICAAIWT